MNLPPVKKIPFLSLMTKKNWPSFCELGLPELSKRAAKVVEMRPARRIGRRQTMWTEERASSGILIVITITMTISLYSLDQAKPVFQTI